jgi:hypothetical protein
VGVWTVGVGVDGLTGVAAAGRGYSLVFEESGLNLLYHTHNEILFLDLVRLHGLVIL